MATKKSSIADEMRQYEREHMAKKHKSRGHTVPLTYPLPQSNTVMGPRGWYHVAWTKETKAEAELHRYKIIPETK